MINLRLTQLATLELLRAIILQAYPDQDDHWRADFRMNLIDRVQQLPNITVLDLMAPYKKKVEKNVDAGEAKENS